MNNPYTVHKTAALGQCALGLLSVVVGFMLGRGPLAVVGVPLTILGCVSTTRGFLRFVRVIAVEQVMGRSGAHARSTNRSHELPKELFLLLQAVAEADGEAGAEERQLVAQFLLERFPDPALQRELVEWQPRRLQGNSLQQLVRGLRMQLSFPECETVFHWCALVTLIDQRFKSEEQEILQQVAHGFGIPANHARRIFLHAKARVLAGQQGYGSGGASAPQVDSRQEAFEILGLENDAQPEDIRRRHRELVKKYHPDAHSHLGPVAAREATERFREIQRAYETLTA